MLAESGVTGLDPAGTLFGRDADLARLSERLASGERLISLVGPGGVGKTRLARALLSSPAAGRPGAARFVECDVAETPADLVRVISQALALTLPTPSVTALVEAMAEMSDRPRLLILDNLEQARDAGPVVSAIVEGIDGLTIVVTSRVPLGGAGELVRVVRPLPVDAGPGGEGPAVGLFLERARQAWAGFRTTPSVIDTVRVICERLDGLPLAIELAAARSAVLAPAAMLARIDRSLTVIDDTVPDLPPRQRSLRATVDWSYDLLSNDERRHFRVLSVFEGPFDPDAAGAILAQTDERRSQIIRWLEHLADQSLLVRRGGDGNVRYAMLQTIRDHARGLLAMDPEEAAVVGRHFRHMLAIAVEADRISREDPEAGWLDRLDVVLPDLRAALRHARQSGDVAGALRLAVHLWGYWGQRALLVEGTSELGALLQGVERGDVPDDLLGRALNYYANLLFDRGDLQGAASYYASSLEIRREVGEPEAVADTLNNFGLVAAASGDFDRARELFSEILEQRRAAGQRYGEALALGNLGDVLTATGDGAAAVPLHLRCLEIREEIGDAIGIGFGLSNLSEAYLGAGDIGSAEKAHRRASRHFRRLKVPSGEALTARVAGDIARARDDHTGAAGHYLDAVIRNDRIGERGAMSDALERLAVVLLATEPDRDAAELYGCAERLRAETGVARWPIEVSRHDAAVAQAMASLGDDAWELARSAGRSISIGDVIGLAKARVERGESQTRSDDAAPPDPAIAGLTPREREVLALVAEGLTSAQIAGRLFISTTTVSAHLRRIFEQLGVSNRTAAAARWLGRAGE
ncbi:MAG TPA: tetratricopeptide repeat protein [Thermomicrobiales bacterium]|nr:tetratricopeptide repeat protein [Thermomicrobiales bacterium]